MTTTCFGVPTRGMTVMLGGRDITEYVTGIEVHVDETDTISIDGPRVIPETRTMTIGLRDDMLVNIQEPGQGPAWDEILADATFSSYDPAEREQLLESMRAEVLNRMNGRGPNPASESGTIQARHYFEQDDNEQARLCWICGMWPDYHAHVDSGRCVCSDCIPDASRFGDFSSYTEGDA